MAKRASDPSLAEHTSHAFPHIQALFRQRYIGMRTMHALVLCLLLAGVAHAAAAPSPSELAACIDEMRAAGGRQLVCGADGNTYYSRCLAALQDTEVASEGPCTPGAGAVLTDLPADGGEPVTVETLTRFEGFK